MELNFDSHTVNIPCGACGKESPQTIGGLKAHPQVTCVCGVVTTVDISQFEKGIAAAQESLDAFRTTLRNLSKR